MIYAINITVTNSAYKKKYVPIVVWLPASRGGRDPLRTDFIQTQQYTT